VYGLVFGSQGRTGIPGELAIDDSSYLESFLPNHRHDMVKESLPSRFLSDFTMFSFSHPGYLILLAAVPPLIWWWQRRRGNSLRYSGTDLLAGLPPGRRRLAQWVGTMFRAAALVLLIVALAGPRWPDLGSRISTEGIAIQIIVDVSGSMAERDYSWEGKPISRLDAAKNAFQLFVEGGDGPDGSHLEGRKSDLIGLVIFARWPESLCPLTLSHSVLLRQLKAEKPRTIPTESETNIGDAIAWGLHRLEGAGVSRKIIVLLTDGEHNVPPPALTPRQAAQFAANQGIPVFAIDAGQETAGKEQPKARINSDESDSSSRQKIRASAERTLQAVADITGGRYFKARDSESLLDVCRKIDQLERQQIQSFQYRRYFEGFPWFGLASLVFLGLCQALEKTFWLKVP
jgi:Ca-activated chloride channel homolog